MTAKQAIAYMDKQPLVHALMWFIENISDDTLPQAERSEVFFALRSRYRKEMQESAGKAFDPDTIPDCPGCGVSHWPQCPGTDANGSPVS